MSPAVRRLIRCLVPVLPILLPGHLAGQVAPPVAVRVDHVPVAVRSLPEARRTFQALGFRLKEGRPHDNGLRNAFAKLPDGSYLELITPERGATDEATARYASLLEQTEGGAYLALRADSLPRLARRLEAAGHRVDLRRYGGAFTTAGLPDTTLSWLFLIEYLAPVHDTPEVLDHPNTAVGIETVWLTGRRHAALRSLAGLLAAGGVQPTTGVGGEAPVSVAGVTLRVRSVEAARRAVRAGADLDLPVRSDARGRSVLVPAARAHGIWIELLEPGPPPDRLLLRLRHPSAPPTYPFACGAFSPVAMLDRHLSTARRRPWRSRGTSCPF